MKKALKWLGVGLAGLVGLVVLLIAMVYVVSNRRMNATYDIAVKAVEIPSEAEALARGQHVAIIRGCADCHGANLAGASLIDDPAIGQISPGNLTAGAGGIGESYSDCDAAFGLGPGAARRASLAFPIFGQYRLQIW